MLTGAFEGDCTWQIPLPDREIRRRSPPEARRRLAWESPMYLTGHCILQAPARPGATVLHGFQAGVLHSTAHEPSPERRERPCGTYFPVCVEQCHMHVWNSSPLAAPSITKPK